VYLLGYTASSVELAAFGRETLNQENNFTPLIVISVCYLFITVPLAIVVRRMEARAERAR
jgi:polar amino acid transport system permease protein